MSEWWLLQPGRRTQQPQPTRGWYLLALVTCGPPHGVWVLTYGWGRLHLKTENPVCPQARTTLQYILVENSTAQNFCTQRYKQTKTLCANSLQAGCVSVQEVCTWGLDGSPIPKRSHYEYANIPEPQQAARTIALFLSVLAIKGTH